MQRKMGHKSGVIAYEVLLRTQYLLNRSRSKRHAHFPNPVLNHQLCPGCPHQHGGSKFLQDTNGHIFYAFSWNYACSWYVGFSSRFKWLQFVLNPNSRHFYCPLSCLSDYMNTLLRHTLYAMVLPVAKEQH